MHFEGCKHTYFVNYFLLKLSQLMHSWKKTTKPNNINAK
jgi:hypothetical protein